MADDEIKAKELLEQLNNYHDEIVALARETTSSVAILDSASKQVKATEKKFWNVFKPWIVFWVTLFVLLIIIVCVAITMSHTDLCVVNVSDSGKNFTITSCRNLSRH